MADSRPGRTVQALERGYERFNEIVAEAAQLE